MELAPDLAADILAAALAGRAVRVYPAMLSTEADALAWARAGAPSGAVVVAHYQASARGRAGLEWKVEPGLGLGFSLVLRPSLAAEREGWLYTAAVSGLADVVGPAATIGWPDEVWQVGVRAAAVGVHAELGPEGVAWATVTVLVPEAVPPRAALLARVLAAIEERMQTPPREVLDGYRARCTTLGQRLAARLIPMGPSGVVVTGTAADLRDDGSLVIVTDEGRRVAVPPQHLGVLDTPCENDAADVGSTVWLPQGVVERKPPDV